MALFTENRLRTRAGVYLRDIPPANIHETLQSRAGRILQESWKRQTDASPSKTYDIFLSHSTKDAQLILGLKLEIEDLGFSVYVDWIEDPQLNRENVTKRTALYLQFRMKQCKSMIYAFSENSTNSKWMPWELGYFDGIKGKVAILPITLSIKDDFKGTEYLGIYYYIQIAHIKDQTKSALWVHETGTKYIMFDYWINGNEPIQR